MKFTNQKIDASRSHVRAQEARVARQREMIEQAISAQHPLDDLQARLMVMEQSLLAMKRFLSILERDLEQALGVRRPRRRSPAKTAAPEADQPGADQSEAAEPEADPEADAATEQPDET